jgi:hypothetical protein
MRSRVAGHLLKNGQYVRVPGSPSSELFPEELFADLFGSRRGRPSVPAEVMASVITLQRCTACPITRPSMR